MLHRSFVLGSVALACLATTGAAQSMPPLRLGVSLGTSFGDREWYWPEGTHVALSLRSQSPGSRFGLRVDAIFEHITGGSRGLGFAHTERVLTTGLAINPTYRLTGRQTGLYAMAGLGVYLRWYEGRLLYGPGDDRDDRVTRSSGSGLDANVGLGFDFKAFEREMFVESRLHGWAFSQRALLSFGVRC